MISLNTIRCETARGVAGRHHAISANVAGCLSLAAAPTFTIMALLTATFGGGMPDGLCATAGASPFGGMVPMYLLMSVFHLAPWLKLVSRWRPASRSVT